MQPATARSSGASNGLRLSARRRDDARVSSGLPGASGRAKACASAVKNAAARAGSASEKRTRKALLSTRVSTAKPAATRRASTVAASAVVSTGPRSVATAATIAGVGSPSRETSVRRGRASMRRTSIRPTEPSRGGVELPGDRGARAPGRDAAGARAERRRRSRRGDAVRPEPHRSSSKSAADRGAMWKLAK